VLVGPTDYLMAWLAASCAFCSPGPTGVRPAKISLKIGAYALAPSPNLGPNGGAIVLVPAASPNAEVSTFFQADETDR